jgi:Lysyl oxidase
MGLRRPLQLGCALTAALAFAAAAHGAELLPDLDPQEPTRPFVTEAEDGSGAIYLTFNAAFANVGKGPLILRGHRGSTDEPTMTVDQYVALDDGTETGRPGVGTFAYDEGRRRWGFAPFLSYELRPVGGEIVGRGPDVGFCVVDTRAAERRKTYPGQPPEKVYRDCGRGRPGMSLLELGTGISVGWMNWHKAGNEGQLIDITNLPAGKYVLAHRVNQSGAIAEASTKNNASSVLLSIKRPNGGLPTVEVLRECPNSGKCKPPKKRKNR